MKLVRKRRNVYAMLFIVTTYLSVWFSMVFITETIFVFGAISMAFFVLLVRQSYLLYDVALIWDNRIVVVPSALVLTKGDQQKNDMEVTVVSTFGLSIGSKIYRWGRDGVHGVRLNAVLIDKERMYLTFGDAIRTTRVELLHGITEEEVIMDVAQKLWHETGVTAKISGW